MSKTIWKPGTMLYPVPAVLVSCGNFEGKSNLITIAWTGTLCTDPAMTYISIRPERYSYGMIKDSGEFVINLSTRRLVKALDYCGVKSGRDTDKFSALELTPEKASLVAAPLLKESPLNIECKVEEIKKLGSHDMFIAKVLCIQADKEFINPKGAFDLSLSEPICYSHGKYYALGKELGHFGFSVRKSKKPPHA